MQELARPPLEFEAIRDSSLPLHIYNFFSPSGSASDLDLLLCTLWQVDQEEALSWSLRLAADHPRIAVQILQRSAAERAGRALDDLQQAMFARAQECRASGLAIELEDLELWVLVQRALLDRRSAREVPGFELLVESIPNLCNANHNDPSRRREADARAASDGWRNAALADVLATRGRAGDLTGTLETFRLCLRSGIIDENLRAENRRARRLFSALAEPDRFPLIERSLLESLDTLEALTVTQRHQVLECVAAIDQRTPISEELEGVLRVLLAHDDPLAQRAATLALAASDFRTIPQAVALLAAADMDVCEQLLERLPHQRWEGPGGQERLRHVLAIFTDDLRSKEDESRRARALFLLKVNRLLLESVRERRAPLLGDFESSTVEALVAAFERTPAREFAVHRPLDEFMLLYESIDECLSEEFPEPHLARYGLALLRLQRSLSDPPTPKRAIQEARALVALGRGQEALTMLRQYLDESPPEVPEHALLEEWLERLPDYLGQ